jgi:hypothetical protein
MVLHFILLRLSFRLWVWNWLPRFLKSLPIFNCRIWFFSFYDQKLFPGGIIVPEVWNSTYVVLIINCVFILKMFCSLSFLYIIYTVYPVVEKVCDIKYYVKNILFFCNCFHNVTFPSTFQFLIIFGTGFEVLTVVRIHNVVWVRTSYSLLHTWL